MQQLTLISITLLFLIIHITASACENIENGEFKFGTTAWDYWQGNGANGSFSVTNEEGVISISNGASGSSDVRLRQFGHIFENGNAYTVSFKAKATSPRTIEIRTRQTVSPWTTYHQEIVNLTTSYQTITFQFTMNEPDDFDGRISFLLGGNNASIYLDDVSLQDDGCVIVPVTHPVIMGDESQYAALRAKSSQAPFSQIKNQAINDANSNSWLSSQYYSSSSSYIHRSLRLKDITNACALGYILDPSNEAFYVNKATTQMLDGFAYLSANRPSGWEGNVPLGAAVFNSILALDIMYNDMAPSDRSTIEDYINGLANSLSNNWAPSAQAIKAIWALYTGDQTKYNLMVKQHDIELFAMFSPDGVFYPGTGYAGARMLGDDRNQKHFLLDILEHRGENNYYNNPKLVKGHEWIFGYSTTPFGKCFPFGDSAPTSTNGKWSNSGGSYRAVNFSQDAMEYSNNLLVYDTPKPNLVLYFVLEPNTYDPTLEGHAPSKIFPDGGAWFREKTFNTNILSSALWNVTSLEAHQHYETNAISLAGHGELLLTNAGYNGYYSSQGSYTWDDINKRAVSANTVLIDYPLSNSTNGNFPATNNHVNKTGAGIEEGLTTNKLDYACGNSGNALPNGQHQRNFLFVHPEGQTPGYWILMDDISTSGSNSTGHIALHPHSTNVTTVATDKEYRWSINEFSNTTAYLSIHLAQQPDNLQLLDGISTDWDGGVEHKYLYSTYDLGSTGHREIITLLFPHQSSGNSPNTTQLNTSSYTGIVADMGNTIEDHTLESSTPTQSITYGNHSFAGAMSTFRTNAGTVDWYFVKRGTSFSSGNNRFSAGAPISLFMDGRIGKVTTANATQLSLAVDQINMACAQLFLNGQPAASTLSNGMISFTLPAGTYNILLEERCLELELSVFLEGVLNTNTQLMSDQLSNLNLLPLTDPYVGTYNADPSIFTNPSLKVVDWVWIALLDKNNPNLEIEGQAGILLSDGRIIAANGETLNFASSSNDYYLFVKHRNHLPIMSANWVSFTNGQLTSYDFTTQNSYTGGGSGQKNLGTKWAMFAGDSTPSPIGHDINGADKILWLSQNGLFLQYLEGDYNMDGDVNGADNLLFYKNTGTFSGAP